MALQTCQSGTISGFPISLSQKLYDTWPGISNLYAQIETLIAPTDFTIQWGPPAKGLSISVSHTPDVFQISGFNTISDQTTLTYGLARYRCSEILSIVQNQHKTLGSGDAEYEVILAFYIQNKSQNPSSPDVILMCRPLAFSTTQTSSFWTAVNASVKNGSPQSADDFDMSRIYGYDEKVLMPMITYQTCLPVKLLNYSGSTANGSISIRVHVVNQPLYIIADPGGTGVCSSVAKYTLAIQPGRPADLFDGASSDTIFQFQNGQGTDAFPSGSLALLNNIVPMKPNSIISSFKGDNSVLNTFVYLVPEEFLGKSLAEIAEAKSHTPKEKKKKSFKCYKLDPDTDIKGDQILIDPTTGESLSDVMKQKTYDDTGDPAYLNINGPDTSGIMPGDIQHGMFIALTTIGTILLLAHLSFILYLIFGPRKDINGAIYNGVIFAILLIGLVLFGVYFGEQPP